MAAHRYWRIHMIACGSTAYAFAEMQFRTTAGVPLLFSGGTATAADTFSGQPGPYDASHVVDNDINTLYSSTNTTQPQWVAYDFGATSGNWRDVVEISITARNDTSYQQAPQTFEVQWSDDNSSWTTQTLACVPANWSSAGQVQLVSALPFLTTIDGSAVHGSGPGNSSHAVTLTTTQTNDIICVLAYSENSGGTKRSVSSVSGGGLTWARRAQSNSGSAGISDYELWWALAPTALSAVAITVTFSGTYDDSMLVAFGVHGCNTAAPFDPNASVPAVRSNDGSGGFTGISTTNANDLLIFAMSSAWAPLLPGQGQIGPTGFAYVNGAVSSAGGLYGSAAVWSRGVAAPTVNQSYSMVFNWPTNGNGVEAIFDALTAPPAGGAGAQARAMVLA